MYHQHKFKAIYTGTSHRWNTLPFDLKFDSKWTNQKGSTITMDQAENIHIRVDERSQTHCGMYFSTGLEWAGCAAGKRIRLTLRTASRLNAPIPFQLIYLTQNKSNSGYFKAFANIKPSTISLEYRIPTNATLKPHLVVVDPLVNELELSIYRATLQILNDES